MPSVNGARTNGTPLSLDSRTFVSSLMEDGYDTALIGKCHLQNMTGLPPAIIPGAKDNLAPPPAHLRDAIKQSGDGPQQSLEDETRWTGSAQSRLAGDFYGFDHIEIATGHADQVKGDYLDWARARHPNFDALVGAENAIGDNRYHAPQAWRTSVPEELYPTSYVRERTEAFLTEHVAKGGEAPFFAQVSFPDPHHPFTPPGRYWDMYDPDDIPLPASFGKGDLPPLVKLRAQLQAGTALRTSQDPFVVTEEEARATIALTYGMITMIDDAVGRILAHLDSLGLTDDTIVIFTSDHGDHMGDHGLMLKLLIHYHGTIHVPFLWREPAGKGGALDDQLASSMDISATVLERAGMRPFNGIQGRNLFDPDRPARTGVLIEEESQRLVSGFDRLQRVRTLVTRRHRMSLRHGEEWGELFDLDSDPDEIVNLWDDPGHAELRAELIEKMARHMIAHQDHSPLPTGRA
jgi:arylsulfatase A-like enzyme